MKIGTKPIGKYSILNLDRSVKIAAIIGCLSLAYYLVIYLPNQSKIQTQEKQITTQKGNLAMKERCKDTGEAFYKKQKTEEHFPDYTVHPEPRYAYNKSLNTCLISSGDDFQYEDKGSRVFIINQWVKDSLTGDLIAKVSFISGQNIEKKFEGYSSFDDYNADERKLMNDN